MGRPVPAVDRPLQATVLAATRSCWASGVEAAEWAGFVREAARRDAGEKTRGEGSSKATTDGLAEEASLGETVCGAILELLESSPSTAPRLLLYLHEALVTPIGSEPLSSPNEAALAVLRRCETVEADRSEPALYALDRLSTALLAHPVPPSLATASPKIALARLIRLLDLHHLLSTSAEVSGVGRPTILLAQLLLPTLAASVRSLRRRSFDGIAEARDAAVEKLSQALLSPPPFVDLGQLAALLRHLSPSTARSLAFEHADPSQATHEEISISASAVIAHLLLTPGSIAATETASGRLEAFARLHIDRKPDTSWTAEILFATATMGPTSPDLEDAVWTAFLAGGRLCELLELTAKRLDASPAQRLSSADLARLKSLLLMEALSTGLEPEQTSSEDFKASKEAVWATLLSQLRRSGLVSSDDDAEMAETSDQVLPYEQALSSLRQTLPQAPGDDSVGALAASTVETLASAASPSSVDLGLLCSLTEALGAAETQAVLLLWVSPASLLGPVRRVLDGWNDDGWGAAGQEGAGFEQFGQLLGFIQGIVGRFGLRDDLAAHLGSTSGFTAQHLLAPGSSYSLSALSPPQRQTLASWIDALYGNSGISDDLLTGTDPRMLVQLAPTVFRQSFEALRVGVMDAENIKEGLSYFEQGLLGGCAVGVMSWLVDELSRVEPSLAPSYAVMMEILQSLILSNIIPRVAVELTAAKTLRLIRSIPPALSSLAPNRLAVEERLTSFGPSITSRPGLLVAGAGALAWDDALRIALAAVVAEPSDPSMSAVGKSLWSMLPTAPTALMPSPFVDTVLSFIRSYAVLPEGTTWDAAAYRRTDRAVEVGAAVLTWPWTDRHGVSVFQEVVLGYKRRLDGKSDDEIVLEREVLRRSVEMAKRNSECKIRLATALGAATKLLNVRD